MPPSGARAIDNYTESVVIALPTANGTGADVTESIDRDDSKIRAAIKAAENKSQPNGGAPSGSLAGS